MEQVRVRIGDDESWCRGTLPIGRRMAGVTARKAHAVTDSSEVIVVSRDGQCWKFPAGRPETAPELPSP
jgi:hypothetical protein